MDVITDFFIAHQFTLDTHKKDLDIISDRQTLVYSFKEFLEEYIYVVVASGFKGLIAAKLTPRLFECAHSTSQMLTIFKNTRKVNAIHKVFNMQNDWTKIRHSLKSADDLTFLPYIGDITKHHLARNIGLVSGVKPDLHLVRYSGSIGFDNVEDMINTVQTTTNTDLARGSIDFCFWVWLSHDKGSIKQCCNSCYRLR
ncbi:hypothetical protein P9112_005359 [Eukaryota sp. TZLM1-RC]